MTDLITAGTVIINIFTVAAGALSRKGLEKLFGAGWKEYKKKKEEERYVEFGKKYSKKIKSRYGKMKILAMERPIPLHGSTGLYTNVNILDKLTAFKGATDDVIEKMAKEGKGEWIRYGEVIGDPKPGLEVIKEPEKKLFILGKPGAGKTTFCKFLALSACAGNIGEDAVPIFISLRDYADSKNNLEEDDSLIEFIADQFKICGFADAKPLIEKILKSGKAIILFDGLDEVNIEDKMRSNVIKRIRNFSEEYEECRHVITCRIAASDYSFEHFDYVEMADFSEEQVDTFVKNWFKKDKKKLKRFLDDFKKPEYKGLRELATNPLLLTLLCIGFNRTLKFAPRRSEIYKDALDALLRDWDTSRDIVRDEFCKGLSPDRLIQTLSLIAAKRYEKNETVFKKDNLEQWLKEDIEKLPKVEISGKVDGRKLLKGVCAQHGLFIERAKGIFTFSHLTFQEYLTARYIVDNAGMGTLRKLTETHLFDPRWKEVFLLVAEMLPEANSFFSSAYDYLDKMIKSDQRLIKWLQKIQNKAEEMHTELFEPSVISDRIFVNYLVIDTYGILTLTFTGTLEHSFHTAIHAALDLVDYSPSISSLPRDEKLFTVNLRYKRPSKVNFDNAITSILSMVVTLSLGSSVGVLIFENPIETVINSIIKVKEICVDLRDNNSARLLSELEIPGNYASRETWEQYAKRLEVVVRQIVPLEDYKFTEEQLYVVAKYMRAAGLLLKCHDVARVSDRTEIERRLFSPPKPKSKTKKK